MAYDSGGSAPVAVTFYLRHAPPITTLAHPNPRLLVNELEDPGAIAGSVRLEYSQSKGW